MGINYIAIICVSQLGLAPLTGACTLTNKSKYLAR